MRTPAHYAAKFNQSQVLNILLEKNKGCINWIDGEGHAPLHLAVSHNASEAVQLLLMRNCLLDLTTDNKSNVLHVACKHGTSDIINSLLNELTKCNREHYILDQKDARGFTCVHWAAIQGHFECVKMFPDFIDVPDHLNVTPLFWAILKGYRTCAQYFISRKCVPNNPDLGDMEGRYLKLIRRCLFSDGERFCE